MSEEKGNIVIKKVKKHGGHGAHGGAWKVAYADFVTAMMAFFIVMWILGMSEESKVIIAHYFNNAGVFDFMKSDTPVDLQMSPPTGQTGDGGPKGSAESKGGFAYFNDAAKKAVGEDTSTDSNTAPSASPSSSTPMNDDSAFGSFKKIEVESKKEEPQQSSSEKNSSLLNNVKLEQDVKRALINMSIHNPNIKELLKSIKVEIVKEGLIIELLETSESVFFEIGSAAPKKQLIEILKKLGLEIGKRPNNVEIEGHTDSRNYNAGNNYTNWELSADRANAARRILQFNGLRKGQIKKVTGYADNKLRIPDDPLNTSNRRITILIRN